jgi:hypothetical protein
MQVVGGMASHGYGEKRRGKAAKLRLIKKLGIRILRLVNAE